MPPPLEATSMLAENGFVLVASLGTNHAKPFGLELQVKQMLGGLTTRKEHNDEQD